MGDAAHPGAGEPLGSVLRTRRDVTHAASLAGKEDHLLVMSR